MIICEAPNSQGHTQPGVRYPYLLSGGGFSDYSSNSEIGQLLELVASFVGSNFLKNPQKKVIELQARTFRLIDMWANLSREERIASLYQACLAGLILSERGLLSSSMSLREFVSRKLVEPSLDIGADDRGAIQSFLFLGELLYCQKIGDLDRARRCKDSLKKFSPLKGDLRFFYALMLHGLAKSDVDSAYEIAVSAYGNPLEIKLDSLESTVLVMQLCLIHTDYHMSKGRPASGMQFAQVAKTCAEDLADEINSNLALLSLAECYLGMNNLTSARECLEHLSDESVTVCLLKSKIAYSGGQLFEARFWLKKAAVQALRFQADVLISEPINRRLSIGQNIIKDVIDTETALCRDSDAFDHVLYLKSLLFDAMVETSSAIAKLEVSDPEMLKRFRETQRSEWESFFMLASGHRGYREKFFQQKVARDELETSIRHSFSEQLEPLSFNAIKASLRNGEAYVEFFVFRNPLLMLDQYMAIVVRKDLQKPIFINLGPASDIDGTVMSWYQSARDPQADADQKTFLRLIQETWAPITDVISERSVWLCPDGSLGKLPWHVVPDINRVGTVKEIKVLENARQLVSLHRSSSSRFQQESMLAVESGLATTVRSDFGLFSALPFATDEVQGLLREGICTPKDRVSAPTVDEFRRRAESATCIHISTHSFWKEPVAGQISTVAGPAYSSESLLSSGLLLAANAETEASPDQFLPADQLYSINLRKCKLMVISACSSSSGEIVPGQGVLGLASAAAAAGCRTTIASLWPVEDQSTALLMKEFYSHLSKGISVRKSFLRAQRTLERRFSHPYRWAGWTIIGE